MHVAVCKDADAGRAAAEQIFARYGELENYQRLLTREGVASPGALAIVGTESVVETAAWRRCRNHRAVADDLSGRRRIGGEHQADPGTTCRLDG